MAIICVTISKSWKRGQILRNPRFFLQQITKLRIEETCMGRQLVLHHTKTRSRSHAGHPILTQRAHPSTSLCPLSSSENVDVLCQRITARTSAHSDGAWSIHARLSQARDKASGSVDGESASANRALVVLLGHVTSLAGGTETSVDSGRLVADRCWGRVLFVARGHTFGMTFISCLRECS